ncbi:diacylglycerol O-acyltransferase [Mycolicibacterium elephantis]|uniref:WS/DGAT/MGAT family O-acyltransferase n=1 Tax=Mycolicibacterium elephantis TaxID=81858 RepID=UPI000629302C|nr:wax ester/triacylglycerol synthase family O-acyltransferase [Mycolicibacterium elephantis]KKW66474.1 diacylglycerol O-acyltransferase [Mycolicibacterium elephantis]OBE97440.1 diacylglycerol O-acyltransferase [Mycolicibacterium elephantis]
MKRLNGMDAMLLYTETPSLHTHTLKVAVIDAAAYRDEHGFEFSFEVFRRTIAARIHLLDPLRYQLVDIPWKLHHPMWLQDCPVDLDYHLRRVQVPSPGGRRELDEVIGQIASTPLDRSRPLWEFHFAEGMADDRFALIGKVHHALADGVASANLLARLMDLAGSAREEHHEYTPCEPPSKTELLRAAGRDHVQHIAALPALIRDAVRGVARLRRRPRQRTAPQDKAKLFKTPSTFLNHVVSPTRTFATATLALADVKQTAKHLDVTFNDIVLATAAGGLRELLLRYDGRSDRPILASVPVATDRSPDRITGNEISGLTVSLPVHIDDPLERVRVTAATTTNAKEVHDLLGPRLQGQAMEYLPPPLTPALFRWQSKRAAHNRVMNVAISSVAGPREHGHIGGARVSEIYSVGVLSAGSAFNMTVWSYVDQVDIAVLSDDQTFDDVHEATDAMVHSFTEIRLAAGLAPPTIVDTAMAPATAVR